MPRPSVTVRRNGITSSGFSGPPYDSSRMPSYGASGPRGSLSVPGWGEVTGILRFAGMVAGVGIVDLHGCRQNYRSGVAYALPVVEDGRVCVVGRLRRWRCKTCNLSAYTLSLIQI